MKKVVFVGAGPQSLTTLLRLLSNVSSFDSDGDLTTARAQWSLEAYLKSAEDVLVLDDSGKWLARWEDRFQRADLTHLRSILPFHPDPTDQDSLLAYATATGRTSELTPIDDDERFFKALKPSKKQKGSRHDDHTGWAFPKSERYRLQVPTVSLFNDFCRNLVERYQLDKCIKQARVVEICPHFEDCKNEHDCPPSHYTLHLSTGEKIHTEACVICSGSSAKNIPSWVQKHKNVIHSDDIDVKKFIKDHQGERVLVVGGGQTAAHISLRLASSNQLSKVVMTHRRYLRQSHFDVPINWIGKHGNREMGMFRRESDEDKAEIIEETIDGGSIAPALLNDLRKLAKENSSFCIQENTIVDCLQESDDPNAINVCFKGGKMETFNFIILATGYNCDFKCDPILAKLNESYEINAAGKYPCLTRFLQWRKDWKLFVQGPCSRIVVGPTGHTLEGARRGSTLINEALKTLQRKEKEREEKSDSETAEESDEDEFNPDDFKGNNFFDVLGAD